MRVDYDGDLDKEVAAAKALGFGNLPDSSPEPIETAKAGPMLSEVFEGFLRHKTDEKERAKEGKKPLSEKEQKSPYIWGGYVSD